MTVYNHTSNTFGFYDKTGFALTVDPASGTGECICFSLGMLTGQKGDFCVWIDGYGQPEIWYQPLNYIVAGTFEPGGKALPQCKDVNVASISSSVYANQVTPTVASPTKGQWGRQEGLMVVTVVGTTTDAQGQTSVFTSVAGTPEATGSSGLSQSDKIAIGVGIGVGLPATIAGIIACINSFH